MMPACDTSMFKLGVKTTRPLEKHRKAAVHDQKLARAYRAVDELEDNTCQVTGVRLTPFHRNDKQRREHHHLKGRNVKPEWVYQPKRILLCSAYVHRLLQSKALLAIGTDARTVTFAWNPNMVDVNRPPFRLKTRRQDEALAG